MNSPKTLKIIIAGILGAFALYIFFYPPNSGTVTPPVIVDDKNDTIKAEIDTTSLCMDYNKYNPSTLQAGLISDMVNIYRANQGDAINRSMSQNDAESVWFSLDSIKKFIYHMDKLTEKQGVAGDSLGLRFYYATYPSKVFWNKNGYKDLEGFIGNKTTEQYEKKHTIVMIPTINIAGNPTDFNPIDKNTYRTGIKKLKSQFNGDPSTSTADGQQSQMGLTGTNSATNDPDGKGNTSAKNHGILTPPGLTAGIRF